MQVRGSATNFGSRVGYRAHEWRCDAGGQKIPAPLREGSRFLAISP